MKLSFSIFWNIPDLKTFFETLFFFDGNEKYSYKVIQNIKKDDFESCKERVNILFYKGYTYVQKDGFVLHLNNLIEGWVNRTRLCALHNKLKAAYICIDDETKYPAFKIDYYEDGKERIIYTLKDGAKWIFYEKGESQFFEKNVSYTEKKAYEKFNYEKLLLLCKNLGVNFSEKDFFIPVSPVYYDFRK